ncbi:thioesterase/thiol ester dehydrase-isomerase [Phanerochaete sordida]|uniref:Thioesterase/thiol ester dehydrase-isomerase n=1 Tax=Phanerochaete sordida TaxID=48140 RepID=A0A9P3GPS4_9APHY|nr:thioesterase/thiol ester dehydrase-isomerase [Phanerochaete sordida]
MLNSNLRRNTLALSRSASKSTRQPSRRLASTSSESSTTGSSGWSKSLRGALWTASVASTAYAIGSLYPPEFATYLTPRIAPPPPDPDHPSAIAYTEELESRLQALPVLQELRTKPDAREWYETRPYMAVPKEQLANSLTGGALRGPAKLTLPPLVRARKDESEAVGILHVGTALCGHEGIVHGGLLATLLDESLGRIALLNLPDKIGVTANLNINYRAPTRADQFIVIKTKLDEKNGRKVRVSGVIEDVDGKVLAEANALFIQPKYAKLLNPSKLHARMGSPPDPSEPPTEGSLTPSPALPPAKAS